MKDARYPVSAEVSLLPLIRAIARSQAALDRVFVGRLTPFGLTPSQFDVLATLGDTEGLTFKALSEQSLITGGTLTPVLNRMAAKGLLVRGKHPYDKRQVIIRLTPAGQALYEETFLPLTDDIQLRLAAITPAENEQVIRLLDRITHLLEQAD